MMLDEGDNAFLTLKSSPLDSFSIQLPEFNQIPSLSEDSIDEDHDNLETFGSLESADIEWQPDSTLNGETLASLEILTRREQTSSSSIDPSCLDIDANQSSLLPLHHISTDINISEIMDFSSQVQQEWQHSPLTLDFLNLAKANEEDQDLKNDPHLSELMRSIMFRATDDQSSPLLDIPKMLPLERPPGLMQNWQQKTWEEDHQRQEIINQQVTPSAKEPATTIDSLFHWFNRSDSTNPQHQTKNTNMVSGSMQNQMQNPMPITMQNSLDPMRSSYPLVPIWPHPNPQHATIPLYTQQLMIGLPFTNMNTLNPAAPTTLLPTANMSNLPIHGWPPLGPIQAPPPTIPLQKIEPIVPPQPTVIHQLHIQPNPELSPDISLKALSEGEMEDKSIRSIPSSSNLSPLSNTTTSTESTSSHYPPSSNSLKLTVAPIPRRPPWKKSSQRMTHYEIEMLIRMQERQIRSDHPWIDDYYYNQNKARDSKSRKDAPIYDKKKDDIQPADKTNQDMVSSIQDNSIATTWLPPCYFLHIPLCDLTTKNRSIHHAANTNTNLSFNFLNTVLGKIPPQSARAPRQLVVLDDKCSTSTSNSISDQVNALSVRGGLKMDQQQHLSLLIENIYLLLLELEDLHHLIDNSQRSSSTNQGYRQVNNQKNSNNHQSTRQFSKDASAINVKATTYSTSSSSWNSKSTSGSGITSISIDATQWPIKKLECLNSIIKLLNIPKYKTLPDSADAYEVNATQDNSSTTWHQFMLKLVAIPKGSQLIARLIPLLPSPYALSFLQFLVQILPTLSTYQPPLFRLMRILEKTILNANSLFFQQCFKWCQTHLPSHHTAENIPIIISPIDGVPILPPHPPLLQIVSTSIGLMIYNTLLHRAIQLNQAAVGDNQTLSTSTTLVFHSSFSEFITQLIHQLPHLKSTINQENERESSLDKGQGNTNSFQLPKFLLYLALLANEHQREILKIQCKPWIHQWQGQTTNLMQQTIIQSLKEWLDDEQEIVTTHNSNSTLTTSPLVMTVQQ